MTNDDDDLPFYHWQRQPPAPRTQRRPGEHIWSFRKDHVIWSCELRVQGEYGVEALILRDGELFVSHRFLLQVQAEGWALEQRADIERGWID
jgi:hypothetical protein